MSTIANLAVKIGANASDLFTVFERVKSGAKSVASTLNAKGLLGGLTGLLEGKGAGGLFGAFNDSLRGGTSTLLGLIPGVGSSLQGVFGVATQLTDQLDRMAASGAEALKSVATGAAKLGLNLQEALTLRNFAGGNFENLERGLFHLGDLLGAAASGSKQAQNRFAELGLGWERLSSVPLPERLSLIVERYKQLSSIQKPRFLAELFGARMGHELGPLLEKGPAGLAAAQRRLEMAGGAGGLDPGALREADALHRQLEEMQNLRNMRAASFDARLRVNAHQMGGFDSGRIGRALDSGTSKIANFWSMAKTLGTGAFVGGIGDLVRGRAVGGGSVAGAAGAMLAIERTKRNLQSPQAQAQVADPAALRQDQLRSQSAELAQSIRDGTASWGLSGDALAIYRLKQEGATAAMLSAANAAMAQRQVLDGVFAANVRTGNVFSDAAVRLNTLDRAFREGRLSQEAFAAGTRKLNEDLEKQADSRAWSVWEETRSPIERAQARLSELNQLLRTGRIDQETYQRATGGVARSLEQAAGIGQSPRYAAAMEKGSREEYSYILAANDRQRGANNPQERLQTAIQQLREIQQRQLEESRRQTQILQGNGMELAAL